MIHMLPAFGTLLAIVANGESVYRYHFAGIGTILAGVLLATTSRGR
jgi:drug/metabolite transporter (DMT)-like permease